MAQLDQMTVGVEGVDGRSEAARPGLLAWTAHVAHSMEGVPARDGSPNTEEGGVEFLGRERKGQVSAALCPQGADCRVVSGLTRITETGRSSPSWPKP